MNQSRLVLSLAVVGLLAGSIAACKSMGAQETTGEYLDDVVISSQVRAKLLDDKALNITQIDIETFKGVVQLSGFVDNAAAKQRATAVAASVGGVRDVRNNLIVK